MIVPDINMLIYAHKPDAPKHDAARHWWQGLVHGTESVGIPWAVATGFVRVISIPEVLSPPVSPTNAADSVADWFRREHIIPINPGDSHMRIFQENLAVTGSGTKLVEVGDRRTYSRIVHGTRRGAPHQRFGFRPLPRPAMAKPAPMSNPVPVPTAPE